MYVGGESERMVGRLIAADRSRWIVATKVASPMGSDPNDRGLLRRWLSQAVAHSLRRLDTDWIDVYYLHWDDEKTPIEETVSTLARLVESGKIHYFGVSNFQAWRVARLIETCREMDVPQPIACQPPCSAMTCGIETELLPCCAHYGVGVVTYSSVARGVLTGKYRSGEAPAPDSRTARNDKRLMQTEFRPESLRLPQQFKEHAERRGVPASHLAIAWVLNNRLFTGVMAGRARWRSGAITLPHCWCR